MRLNFGVKPAKTIFHIFFHSRINRSRFTWVLYVYMRNRHYFDNKRSRWISCFSSKNDSLTLIFFYLGCILEIPRTFGEAKGLFLFLLFPPIHKHSNNFLQFFHLRWLPSIFDNSPCNSPALAQWYVSSSGN